MQRSIIALRIKWMDTEFRAIPDLHLHVAMSSHSEVQGLERH